MTWLCSKLGQTLAHSNRNGPETGFGVGAVSIEVFQVLVGFEVHWEVELSVPCPE